jgi:hypothetical protein
MHILHLVHLIPYILHCTSCCYYVTQYFILHDVLYILILYQLYILDIPFFRFVIQVIQEDLISSLMMEGYCRNMQ